MGDEVVVVDSKANDAQGSKLDGGYDVHVHVHEEEDELYEPWMIAGDKKCRPRKMSDISKAVELNGGKSHFDVLSNEDEGGLETSTAVEVTTNPGTHSVHPSSHKIGTSSSGGRKDVYASPNAALRKFVWNQLLNLDPGNEHAWLLGGDFNAIYDLVDRMRGAHSRLGISSGMASVVFNVG
ncbi:hypothetical protein V6N12_012416 [Hibiscus sabdariffa]|uniref:Uncharacterized protein n=1 Tax=Hibiscus sabdariffa TaxID=183260 RepID=A0ABR1ZR24_9ROSI